MLMRKQRRFPNWRLISLPSGNGTRLLLLLAWGAAGAGRYHASTRPQEQGAGQRAWLGHPEKAVQGAEGGTHL